MTSIAQDAGRRARRRRGLRRQPGGRRRGRARRCREDRRGDLRLSLPESRDHGADERDRPLDRGSLRGLVPDAERGGGAGRRRPRRPACRRASARSTRSTSAAASAGVGRFTISSARPSPSPSSCRVRRSSCCGRAKRTCCTAPTIRSPRPNWSAGSTTRATWSACISASPGNRYWPPSGPGGCRTVPTCSPFRACCPTAIMPSATASRISWSTMRCAIRRCHRASGVASISIKTRSTWSVSSTNWPTPQEPIPSSSGASSWRITRRASRY